MLEKVQYLYGVPHDRAFLSHECEACTGVYWEGKEYSLWYLLQNQHPMVVQGKREILANWTPVRLPTLRWKPHRPIGGVRWGHPRIKSSKSRKTTSILSTGDLSG